MEHLQSLLLENASLIIYIFETPTHKQTRTECLRGHRGMSIPVPEQS